jgi:hypothetical protein
LKKKALENNCFEDQIQDGKLRLKRIFMPIEVLVDSSPWLLLTKFAGVTTLGCLACWLVSDGIS